MHKHDWIIEVCQDLKTYARKQKLTHLEDQLNTALNAARHEILLSDVDEAHHFARDCAVLGSAIGLCNHHNKRKPENRALSDDRCQ